MKYVVDQLIEGCKQQKPAYQKALYQQYAKRMMGICMRYAKDRMEAEDVMHIAFMKVFMNIHSFRDGSFEGWMKRIFVNEAINNFHKNKKHYEKLEHSYDDNTTLDWPDALSEMTTNEIFDLIRHLPEGCRVVFNLYVIEGYGHKEIAEMLGISEGTSKSQLHRAKALLKDKIVLY